jgi:hypothetical protein
LQAVGRLQAKRAAQRHVAEREAGVTPSRASVPPFMMPI